ncbi:hypothetical protein VTN02DRAFT_284 [Thermoascus thermophilus]
MQLSWKPGYSLSRRPVRRSPARRTNRGRSGNTDGPRQFVFVAEHPARDLTAAEEARSAIETPPGISGDPSPTRGADAPDSETDYRTVESQPHRYNSEKQDTFPCSCRPTDDGETQIVAAGGDMGLGACCECASRIAAIGPSPMAGLDLSNTTTSIPPSVLYNGLRQRFGPILERYNQDFCKIPLTADLLWMNPFRYRTDLVPEPGFLVHAVMALAGHHVESPSVHHHRHTALKLLRESLGADGTVEHGSSMLDAIIILFSFDETQSTLGYWRTHLAGAYGLIEACGGIEAWTTSARTEAQIGLLTWWDAITSLLSREDCVFPDAYVEAVVSNPDGREWDFFGLCGCPPSLVKMVMQLARLGPEKRKSSSMREESIQQDQDCMHCSEAWRHGLLLYIYRVFRWEPGSPIPIHVVYRARIIVDHVVACRDESMVARQALLPLFFAGCELRDRSVRQKIVDFCDVWNRRTRYHMFRSTVPLLEEVWAEQEAKGFENVWWGQVVDRWHASATSSSPLQMRLCFG